MKTLIASFLCILSLNTSASRELFQNRLTDSEDKSQPIENEQEILDLAEARATTEGRAVIQTARTMIADNVAVVGSCWDFINAVYDQAGFPSRLRKTAHKGRYAGPYATSEMVQPGDWLYFINHSYGDVEHSGIFVDWIDEAQVEALIISYVGGNRPVTGRYRTYDLSHIFNIMRP